MKPLMTLFCLLLALAMALPAHANTTRLTAYTLVCHPVLGYHVLATLQGKLSFAHARPVRFTATCADGPSTSVFPSIPWAYGQALGVELTINVTLENGVGGTLRTTFCQGSSTNGFFSLRCLGDERIGAPVDGQVSIEKAP